MLNIIFFATMYPVLFLMYFMFKAEGKVKRHTLFGIHFTKEWLSEEECAEMIAAYRHKMNLYLLIFTLIPVINLLIPYFSISFTIWMIWLLALIVAFMLPYALGNHKLQQLKQERMPATENSAVVYAELKNAGSVRTIKKFDFMVPLVLSLGIAIFSLIGLHGERFELYSILIITFAACTLLFYLCALWTDRLRTKVISSHSDINVNYARATRKLWKDCWGACIWFNTLFTALLLGLVLLKNHADVLTTNVILWGSILYCIVTLAFCIRAWNQKIKLDNQYEDKADLLDDNEEKAWIGGIFYYNPKDRRTVVSQRFGMGTTTNMATPAGKICAIIGVASLLILPVCCIWIMLEEFTPISLSIANDTLVAEHLRTNHEISLDTIENPSLLQELPDSTKISGSGMDNLLKGTFRTGEDGKVQFFLNPQNELFIRFTADDTIYYMSGYDDRETQDIYDTLTK